MALKKEISEIVSGMAARPSFYFGTVKELNNLSDYVTVFPCVFMYALQPVSNQFTNNNSINNSYSIYLEFLFQIDVDTSTDQCEVYDVQCIQMINEFLIRLKNYRGDNGGKFFKIGVNDKSRSGQIFNKYVCLTVGRNLVMDLETFYNDELCIS